VNLAHRKKVLRQISYGLYVVTTRADDLVAGGTITWLSQCSMKPPLVMVGVQQDSALRRVIDRARVFAVNLIAADQRALAHAFFKPAVLHHGLLNGYACVTGKTGAPLLTDAPGWFECRVLDELTRGDHVVYVAEVVDAVAQRDDPPLTLRDTGLSYGG
jgi:flavin reductase (DIM6/NTAB) family NADH-FMN oxidoreductase RutF